MRLFPHVPSRRGQEKRCLHLFYRTVGSVYVTGILVMNLVLREQSFPVNITVFEVI
jgi:hypothetical protein